ncbi:hypothetical protein BJY52DRAFT_1223839 [Lactarius psammicola]|nr:hypothetical protein BJY52DRAFT_1223839 [Lactarius psammicola]
MSLVCTNDEDTRGHHAKSPGYGVNDNGFDRTSEPWVRGAGTSHMLGPLAFTRSSWLLNWSNLELFRKRKLALLARSGGYHRKSACYGLLRSGVRQPTGIRRTADEECFARQVERHEKPFWKSLVGCRWRRDQIFSNSLMLADSFSLTESSYIAGAAYGADNCVGGRLACESTWPDKTDCIGFRVRLVTNLLFAVIVPRFATGNLGLLQGFPAKYGFTDRRKTRESSFAGFPLHLLAQDGLPSLQRHIDPLILISSRDRLQRRSDVRLINYESFGASASLRSREGFWKLKKGRSSRNDKRFQRKGTIISTGGRCWFAVHWPERRRRDLPPHAQLSPGVHGTS